MFNLFNCKHVSIYFVTALLVLSSFNGQAQESIKTRFEQALAAIEQARYQEAEAKLIALLKQYPQLHRARAELARLQVKTEQWLKAQVNIEHLLVLDNLPASVRRDLQLLNATVEQALSEPQKQQKHQFEGSILASYGYDTDFSLGNVSEFLVDDIGADIETIFSGSLLYSDFCDNQDLTQPCEVLNDFLTNSGQQAVEIQQTGIVNQNQEFVPYIELLAVVDQRFNVDDSGDFVRNQANFRHIYTSGDNTYQWRNQVNYSLDTPLDSELSEKQLVRGDSELSWRISEHWLASTQVFYNDFDRDQDDSFKYYGIQPELSYLSNYGKWSVRTDWYKKEVSSFEDLQQDSIYKSIAGSWSKQLEDLGLLVSVSSRYTDSDAEEDFFDFNSLGFSLKSLYNISQTWQLSAALSHTEFDFSQRPSVTVKQVSMKINYALAVRWHAFLAWEYNRITTPEMVSGANRSTVQLGIKWQF
ncbi:hypothetical protein J7384_04885 [Endozoicomonas sp. G2_1]|uniref:tetratricopeptide repeat protein n=1 Tax=Endozoicomonas sp. G2_1 TaxID=2821091 RepID=UPI001AD98A2C|nr:hypothetical protein [Endozoicomonas sp. G2_1]MBO9489695.1 hypothetical protein [Endozoicomonas sp. G2_1]